MITKPGRTLLGLPLFPLPELYLFPGAVAPLHIFEPRYRQMVRDLLDTAGRLVLAPYNPDGHPAPSGPAVIPVGGLGEIIHHETLADGRYLIWVLGLARAELTEVPSDRLYRKADVRLIVDQEPDPSAADHIVPHLLDAIQNRAPRGHLLQEGLSLGLLADILLNALPLDPDRSAAVFTERCPVKRARKALLWHTDG